MSVGIEVEQRVDQLDDSVDVDGNLLVLSLLKVAVGTKLLEIGIFDLATGGQHHEHAVAHLLDRGTQTAGKAVREVQDALGNFGAYAHKNQCDRLLGANAAHHGLHVVIALGAPGHRPAAAVWR